MKIDIIYDSVSIGDGMKKIIVSGVILGCLFLLTGCGCTKEKSTVPKIDENTLSGKFFDNQMLDVLEIQNFNIAIEDGASYISFDVSNTAESEFTLEYIKILLYDAQDNLILETYGYIGGALVSSEVKHIVIPTDIELSSVARVVYEKM